MCRIHQLLRSENQFHYQFKLYSIIIYDINVYHQSCIFTPENVGVLLAFQRIQNEIPDPWCSYMRDGGLLSRKLCMMTGVKRNCLASQRYSGNNWDAYNQIIFHNVCNTAEGSRTRVPCQGITLTELTVTNQMSRAGQVPTLHLRSSMSKRDLVRLLCLF